MNAARYVALYPVRQGGERRGAKRREKGNCGHVAVIYKWFSYRSADTGPHAVIASEAKQSTTWSALRSMDCFIAALLATTALLNE